MSPLRSVAAATDDLCVETDPCLLVSCLLSVLRQEADWELTVPLRLSCWTPLSFVVGRFLLKFVESLRGPGLGDLHADCADVTCESFTLRVGPVASLGSEVPEGEVECRTCSGPRDEGEPRGGSGSRTGSRTMDTSVSGW